MINRIVAFGIILASLMIPTLGQADTLALWDFNDGNTTVDTGSGTMSFIGGTQYGFENDPGKVDPNDPGYYSLEVSTWPAQTAANKTAGMQFNVSTAGQSNIRVKFDLRHNIKNGETSPNTVLFQYTTDGSTWIDGPTWIDSGDQWYLNREVDLSSMPGVSDNASFKFRIVAAWQPGAGQYMPCDGSVYAASRKWRLDLIKVYNDPVVAEDKTIALWDFNDQRDLNADYGDGISQAYLIGGVVLDGDGYSDDFFHDEEPWDFSSSSDPSLKGKGLDTSGYPTQGVDNLQAGIEYRVSTADCSGIKVSFDVKHKMQSAKNIRLLYTTNINASPVVWVSADPLFSHEISDPISTAWWFNNNTVDLTGAVGVDNNPNFAFKIVTAFDPYGSDYAASGIGQTYDEDPYYNKLRFDMIRVKAENAPTQHDQTSIVETKQSAEWRKVAIEDGIVTRIHPDYFWVQGEQGFSGIKVYAPQHGISEGWHVNISGVTRTSRDTEKYIYSDSVSQSTFDTTFLNPVFMTNKNVGGRDWFYSDIDNSGQCGVPDGVGLNNVGTYVKVAGTVTAVMHEKDDPDNLEFIYIDDGSHLVDGTLLIYKTIGEQTYPTRYEGLDDEDPALASPVTGLRVALTKNFTQSLVQVGDYVTIEGISSIDRIGSYTDQICRAIRRPVVSVVD
ncbi:hypothetical protein LLG46_09795 [bacterium]|nr:hypothetical protein [bacterium]